MYLSHAVECVEFGSVVRVVHFSRPITHVYAQHLACPGTVLTHVIGLVDYVFCLCYLLRFSDELGSIPMFLHGAGGGFSTQQKLWPAANTSESLCPVMV